MELDPSQPDRGREACPRHRRGTAARPRRCDPPAPEILTHRPSPAVHRANHQLELLYMSMSLDGYIAGPTMSSAGAWETAANGCTTGRHSGRGVLPAARTTDRRAARDRCGPGGTADCRARRSLGRRASRCPDLRARLPAARPLRRQLPVGDLVDRWDRQGDGPGEGRRRGPERAGAGRVHRAAGARGRVLDELDRSTRSRCCSVVAVGCSRCCPRAWSWRSFG